uniref:Uncharacterized protein n=1 Tax=Arundo donax TaxID=35708 RepID=A0A0A9CTQ1_ARUDO
MTSTCRMLCRHENSDYVVQLEVLLHFPKHLKAIVSNCLMTLDSESWLHRINPRLAIWVFKLSKGNLSMNAKFSHLVAADLWVKCK